MLSMLNVMMIFLKVNHLVMLVRVVLANYLSGNMIMKLTCEILC